jgi:hypothetical protein
MRLISVTFNSSTSTEVVFPAGRNQFISGDRGSVHWDTDSSVDLNNSPLLSDLPSVLDLGVESSLWGQTDSGTATIRFLNYPKAC